MAKPADTKLLRVALVGNPNTGKSTLFSALVGVHQHVGNYPGVTVEKKTGLMTHAGLRLEIIDLPGLYSLAPRSRDETVAVEVLFGCEGVDRADAAICIVDASNLSRSLYLVSQVTELGLPTVIAVNMMDLAERRGVRLNLEQLGRRLQVAVVPVQAHRRIGLGQLCDALVQAIEKGAGPTEGLFPEVFDEEADRLGRDFPVLPARGLPHAERALRRRLLLDVGGLVQRAMTPDANGSLQEGLIAARLRLAAAQCPVPEIETTVRHAWTKQVLDGIVAAPLRPAVTGSDRADRWLTHRWVGLAIFAIVMALMFQAVFSWAGPAMRAIDLGSAALGRLVEATLAKGPLQSLLVAGVIGGVGAVLRFLPQIMVLFLFIAILEDCGYMARAAYLMDRLMTRVGLSGKAFIPMLSSFACTVPGVMAARVIEDERDRLTTIVVAPLLTCSARLPIYALLIGALVPDWSYLGGWVRLQGLTLAALYLLGIVAAIVAAMVLKRTVLRGRTAPLLMELPSYKWPSPRTVLLRVLQRASVFLRNAGTLILAVSLLVWAALYYPHNTPTVRPLTEQSASLEARSKALPPGSPERAATERERIAIERQIDADYQRHSFLSDVGHVVEPAVRPLGWDWRIGCAVLASLPAREVVVATLGVMYNLDDPSYGDGASDSSDIGARLRSVTWEGSDRPVFSLATALSLMVFFALCAQCAPTLAVIRRETGSWRWPLFTFTYMTVLAYVGALATYHLTAWLGG